MIKFDNIKKTFRRTEVLKGLNLDINKGDRIALVGSNGAGKTTMIRCLLGEYTYEGQVLVNGKCPRTERELVLKDIGFVPQLPPPLKMLVGQLIEFSASLCDADPKEMISVLERLGLSFDELKARPFVKLSGGQKQKLLISIALGRNAKILILDEPAANLDPEARHIFFQLLAEKKDDVVMLISSHRLDEVAALVNRVIEMDQGIVILDDCVEDSVELDSVLQSEIKIKRADEAFAKAIKAWNFESDGGMLWHGQVAGPDRLRFLGVLSRYAAILQDIHMEEQKND
ncbi:MAG: ABC transporter ATP-binding protein [gamma proteobacterium symbiont of Bathyaustriella thionipta]|nr:ABC transporter ATP-binding protein [gamma proteobacterium symbiont of Bathyaustriella thionipta]MCU7949218.1 ABC transporter ATP-binding protein [gamma proteobacterium symbiont of Bathyaustriella thionipta]MCU7953693.1 ABC transporter ATP-binding protein [gamma proteobacterium symbiont of Bathyaustriella thionipta]MCU7955806.1 ABC transporter ATP-binding protein [gamma proteobacterium symbiont of Bathyaustriella thionipta]MCU7967900.1 ABC transporter ATP-binding protein [gamma proteobacteri